MMEAKSKFWKTPELVEKLVSLLDPVSTLGLVQSEVLDKKILQKSLSLSAWNQIIRRSSSYGGGPHREGLLEKEDVKDAVKILKLMKLEDPSMYLLPLLDVICQFLPGKVVEVICPCHSNPHSISSDAFLLLEEVESAFGTSEQSIKSIPAGNLYGPLLAAVVSRMSRQKEEVVSVHVHTIFIKSKGDAHAFATLLQAQAASTRILQVIGSIGEDGWRVLARALQLKPNMVVEVCVSTSRQGFAEAGKENIKEIWDAMGIEAGFIVSNTKVDHCLDVLSVLPEDYEYDWARAWTRLEQILDMTEEEFYGEIEPLDHWSLEATDGGEEQDGEEGEEEES